MNQIKDKIKQVFFFTTECSEETAILATDKICEIVAKRICDLPLIQGRFVYPDDLLAELAPKQEKN